jgi:hypothetical protein
VPLLRHPLGQIPAAEARRSLERLEVAIENCFQDCHYSEDRCVKSEEATGC